MTQKEFYNDDSMHSTTIKRLDKEELTNLTQWYKDAIERKETKLYLLAVFLLISIGSQFLIIDYSLVKNFGLDKDSPNFWVEMGPVILIGMLITAALPVTTFVDEFKLLDHPLTLNIGGKTFSPIIWIILPSDFLLTFQAICVIGWDGAKHPWIITLIGFLVAAIFATSSLYSSRGIAASFRQLNEAKKHLQILKTYGVSPIDLYEDIDKVDLRKKLEMAIQEAENLTLGAEKIKNDADQSLSNLEVEKLNLLKAKQEEIIQLEERVKQADEDVESFNKLKTKFNKMRNSIADVLGQGQPIFSKFSELDTSIKDFNFPSVKARTSAVSHQLKNSSPPPPPEPKYYIKWQGSDYSWEELELPSKLSLVGRKLLGSLIQDGGLPKPTVSTYSPSDGVAACMILQFEATKNDDATHSVLDGEMNNVQIKPDTYCVKVYCRDEDYGIGEKWDENHREMLKEKITNEENSGLNILSISSEEIMGNPLRVLEKIEKKLKHGKIVEITAV